MKTLTYYTTKHFGLSRDFLADPAKASAYHKLTGHKTIDRALLTDLFACEFAEVPQPKQNELVPQPTTEKAEAKAEERAQVEA